MSVRFKQNQLLMSSRHLQLKSAVLPAPPDLVDRQGLRARQGREVCKVYKGRRVLRAPKARQAQQARKELRVRLVQRARKAQLVLWVRQNIYALFNRPMIP